MKIWMTMMSLLAQAAPSGGGAGGTGAPSGPTTTPIGPGPSMNIFLALLMAMVVFMFLSQRSQTKKKERERKNMFDRLSKNDRVLTIGGVIGTVHTIKEGHEVILKVDESTNTKMTFVKSAIQRIITDDANVELETQ